MTDIENENDDEILEDEEVERTMVLDQVDIPPPPSDEGDVDDTLAMGPPDLPPPPPELPPPPPELPSVEDMPEDILDDSELEGSVSEDGFGGPEDASEEQPMLVVGGSDEVPAIPVDPDPSDEAPIAKRPRETPLRGAYEYLEIRTPIAEFESYARARTEALVRLGDTEDAEVAGLALQLGTEAIKRAMGAIPKERS